MKTFIIQPFLSERLWGGKHLSKYNFCIPENTKIGEAWVTSALAQGPTYVEDEGQKITFEAFFSKYKAVYFNTSAQKFPLLAKIISANDWLSVQVHPDDAFALKHESSLGKPECWYVLDAKKDAYIIYGHHAKNKKELEHLVATKNWKQLLRKVPIKKHDFIYIPPGTVHSLAPHTTVFELQRSSDVTYRFYDYDRLDKNNQLRPLMIDKSIAVTTIPSLPHVTQPQANLPLITNQYFTCYYLDVDQKYTLVLNDTTSYALVTVTKGSIKLNNTTLKMGQSCVVCQLKTKKLVFNGKGEAFVSYAPFG